MPQLRTLQLRAEHPRRDVKHQRLLHHSHTGGADRPQPDRAVTAATADIQRVPDVNGVTDHSRTVPSQPLQQTYRGVPDVNGVGDHSRTVPSQPLQQTYRGVPDVNRVGDHSRTVPSQPLQQTYRGVPDVNGVGDHSRTVPSQPLQQTYRGVPDVNGVGAAQPDRAVTAATADVQRGAGR